MVPDSNITYAVIVKGDTIEVDGKMEPVYDTVGHFTEKKTAEGFIKDFCKGLEAECVVEIKKLDYKVTNRKPK